MKTQLMAGLKMPWIRKKFPEALQVDLQWQYRHHFVWFLLVAIQAVPYVSPLIFVGLLDLNQLTGVYPATA